MKFTLSWLGEYVSLDSLTPEELSDRLTMLGLEVDAVETLYSGLEDIVTAKVLAVSKHPNADRLSLCEVEVGDEIVPIVCGAANVREGLVTAIARPGSRLPDGHTIKKAKVRGEVSLGMLCSWRELGISEDHTGILELSENIDSGLALKDVLRLSDTLVEVDLTPNRADCASVIGIAREVAGFTRQTLRLPVTQASDLENSVNDFSITIQDPELCPRYTARKLSHVTVKPSPWWLQRQLLAVGMRPINNIVDITNFVMLEYGQPLHAFDFNRISGKAIAVRLPLPSETTFTTLDQTERQISPETLMICDADKPIAVAGVMGGLNSEVVDETTEILLEGACFDPVSIRRTARNLNLPSEASYRFERGVDPDNVHLAVERAVQLMCELADARVENSGIDVYPGKKDLLELNLRVARVNSLLGIDLSASKVADYLQSIAFIVEQKEEKVLSVTVPSFRVDIEREIDLVEEIARLVGYNEIPTTQPLIQMDYPQCDPLRQLRQKTLEFLTSRGFSEAINYSFVSEKHADMMGLSEDDPRRKCVKLLNPLSEDQAVMRTMLLPGMLENLRRNINFQQISLRLFEVGKVFVDNGAGKQPGESYQLCAVMSGLRYPGASPFYFSGENVDIFDIKGVAERLLQHLRIAGNAGQITLEPGPQFAQTYGDASAAIGIMDGEVVLGRINRLARKVARSFSLKQDVFFCEIDLESLVGLPTVEKSFHPLPRFPSVKRDIALLVPNNVPSGDLLNDILAHKLEDVVYADIFDVYSGKSIDEDMKSVALTVTYRSTEKTLNDEIVDGYHKKIVDSLMSRFGGRYREGNK